MSANIIFNNVLLCDYVTQGLGNKYSLINVYSGDVIVLQYPAILNLGFYAEFHAPNMTPVDTVELELILNRSVFGRITWGLHESIGGQPTPSNPAVLSLPNFQVNVSSDCTLRIELKTRGAKNKVLLAKRIIKGVIPGLTHSLPSGV
jgi:hypothetical protein